METVPADVLAAIKECDLLLKGPTTTPGKGDNLPNIESANVTLRRELDLFANVRPVVIPEKNIDWIFYRENTEGEYALGSRGVDINDDISIDFKVTTTIRNGPDWREPLSNMRRTTATRTFPSLPRPTS